MLCRLDLFRCFVQRFYLPFWAPQTVLSEFPDNHRGVIFMFHGKGGCAALIFRASQSRRFIDDALSRGYAVVAIDSLERGGEARCSNTDWSEPPVPAINVDMQRVVMVRNQLVRWTSLRS
ncbi:MAG: hypothetical protein BMS9Abin06_0712 [Gammaproteobacteria bacterium]|nr:MAG: hypothetical protein BMS9Abin06_0712 [Gammaproteobacteria bacterium]